MNTILWVVQSLLAAVFLFAGGMKFFSIEKVLKDAAPGPGKLSLTRPMLHFIGVSELAGSLGVIVPKLTGVMPQLAPTAAAGLMVVMILATGFHIQRKDPTSKTITTVGTLGLRCIRGIWAWHAVFWLGETSLPILNRDSKCSSRGASF